MNKTHGFGMAVMMGLVAACSAPPAEDPSKLGMRADIACSSDPEKGVGGATLIVSEQGVATTDASGRATVTLGGTEGDTVLVGVRCPSGFDSPAPVRVALRRLSTGSPAARFEARCTPVQRSVVVGIRTVNGANLPIYWLAKRVGQTDSAGAAHLLLHVKPNEQVTLTLDTKERALALRPESPTLTFVAKDRDDFVVLDQRFEERAPLPARPRGPQRLPPSRI